MGPRQISGFSVSTSCPMVTAWMPCTCSGISLPASYDYVAFMKVQDTTYTKIRFDHLYSIYVIFAVAIIARYAWLLWKAVRGKDEAAPDEPKPSSGL